MEVFEKHSLGPQSENNFSSYFPPLFPMFSSDSVMTVSPVNSVSPIDVALRSNGSRNDVTSSNVTSASIPEFNGNSLTVIIIYCILFVIAAVGNLTVFITLFKSRRRKSRISLMISHLAIADLMVTFIMIPLEVGWRITVQWMAGNLACKTFLFLRAFGLYLSSNVLVCVSLDRYFAVLHPLRVTDARRRGRHMLACAWAVSFVCSLPQSVVFHVSSHPTSPEFKQCVSFNFFSSTSQEVAYNLFCVAAMYFIPLLVISVAYTRILCEISKKSRETKDITFQSNGSRLRLRRSDIRNIERARSRTLRMTVTIVSVFVWCWMPYAVMTLWYMFDRDSASRVDGRLQDLFFIMAVSNSCMNPLVYGSYAMNFRRECNRCCGCFFPIPRTVERKSTGGDAKGRFTFHLSRCIRALCKVGSGGTRSTGTCNNLHRVPCNAETPKHKARRAERPHSAALASLGDEAHHVTFHSDPSPQAALAEDLAEHGLLTTRSFDVTMSIGYRKYGQLTRWR